MVVIYNYDDLINLCISEKMSRFAYFTILISSQRHFLCDRSSTKNWNKYLINLKKFELTKSEQAKSLFHSNVWKICVSFTLRLANLWTVCLVLLHPFIYDNFFNAIIKIVIGWRKRWAECTFLEQLMHRAEKIGLNLPWSMNIAGIHIKLLHLVWMERFNLLQMKKKTPHIQPHFLSSLLNSYLINTAMKQIE